MLPFSALLLRDYYNSIGWNEDNSYSQLTRASNALLDFQIPQSLVLQLANAPTPVFFTSHSLDALPQLNGSVSYITTSDPLDEIGPSRRITFRNVIERFRVYPPPRRPVAKDELWLGGRRVEGRDYLLYSRLQLPSLHLSGLATTRLTPTLQAALAFLSQPAPPTPRATTGTPSHSRQPSESPPPAPSTPGNILLSLQHDTGRYNGEYTYSAQDGMFGARGLYNFAWSEEVDSALVEGEGEGMRIDEEEMMEGGLRGRFSAGGEVYFSARQRSFGISTGLRFTTIPPSAPPLPNPPPVSPPTTLTLLYNPLIGYISSAYSAQIAPSVALSSRFGVNVYSYESDLCIGGEWWVPRRRKPDAEAVHPIETNIAGQVLDGASLRSDEVEDAVMDKELDSPIPLTRAEPRSPVQVPVAMEDERDGVIKARLSGNWSVGVLYETRVRNCLVSVGVISDLINRRRPIKSVGLEVQYFS